MPGVTTLGQIIGIHKDFKDRAQGQWDSTYNIFRKPELFSGFTKTHEPIEGNLQQPGEKKLVQANVHELLTALTPQLIRMFDLEATKDKTDTHAKADVILSDGTVFLPDVPVVHLIWLMKKLTNWVTVSRSIPVQSAAEIWEHSASLPAGMERTAPQKIESTRKHEDWKIIVPATSNFPAQAQKMTEDIRSGEYTTIKFTAAIPVTQRDTLVNRAVELLEAVQRAIVVANHQSVTDVSEGKTIFGYLLDGIIAVS